MEKLVFGWLLAGNKPDQAGLKALYALMEPTIIRLKLKRVPQKQLDDRLVKAFPAFYEVYSLYGSKRPEFWNGSPNGLPEFKALRDLKAELRNLWRELYPPVKK